MSSVPSESARKTTSPCRSHHRSTPPPPSSPSSSHVRSIIDVASSVKPIGPEATQEEYDDTLPFKLPPGPYSHTKPNLPYAALIGQAILASPEHRLTVPEIYDYITTVYPHFKRSERAWKSSVRKQLNSAIVFRKVQRDPPVRYPLWAIFDQDLDCFTGGGFRKEFCADIQEQEKTRHLNRKHSAEDALTREPKPKKLKTEASQEQVVLSLHPQMSVPMSTLPAVTYPRPALFPGPRPLPGTYHQPYYAEVPYVPPPAPAGVTFPVLRPAVFNSAPVEPPVPTPPVSRHSHSLSTLRKIMTELEESPSPSLPSTSTVSPPELTPNSSSSSPSEEIDDLDPAAQGTETHRASASVSPKFDIGAILVAPEEDSLDALASSVTLLDAKLAAGENEASKSKKGKEKAPDKDSYQKPSLPRAPESPPLTRQTVRPQTQIPKPTTPPNNVFPTLVKPHATPRINSGTEAWVTSVMESFVSFVYSTV